MSQDPGLRVVRGTETTSTDEFCDVLIPEGDEEVAFVAEKKLKWFKRQIWVVRFQIVSGAHTGLVLPMWINVPRSDWPVRMSHTLAQVYVAATGAKPPRDLARRRPSSFLKDCAFLVHVRTVKRDMNGVERPEEASYSRVAYLIRRTAGTPRCLQGR
jgi:hypothetical protein